MDQAEHSQQQPVMAVAPGGAEMAYAPAPYQVMPVSLPTQVQPFLHHHHQQQKIQVFWTNQMHEIEKTTDFKNHTLPLARIKKIMKADEDVHMISSEAPVVFAKACEMFILELTLRSGLNTEENKRRTLQKNDIAAAISRTEVFGFLVDIIPRDELKEGSVPMVESYFVPPVGPEQARPPMAFVPWPHSRALPHQQNENDA